MNYFDYAATTPMSTEALSAFTEAAQQCFGNESSLHDEGSKAQEVLKASRTIIADSLNVPDETVVFTSGGTESNILAIQTLLRNKQPDKTHIIVSSLEHASIMGHVQQLQANGYEVDFLDHLEDGTISLKHLQYLLKNETALLIVQHVNSEIGIIQPIAQIRQLIKEKQIFLHVDCVQSYGKIDCRPIAHYADSLSISAHKLYGPKGVGAIIFPTIHELQPFYIRATHENGFRAGTVNVPGIYAFAIAAKTAFRTIEQNYTKMVALRKLLKNSLHLNHTQFECVEGDNHNQLPHIICLLFSKVQGQYVMMELNRLGFCVSSGSACQSGAKEPSKALLALGKNEDYAKSSIRISLGLHNTEAQCEQLADAITTTITAIHQTI